MNELYYEMDCGCRFRQYGTDVKENDGLPPISIDFYNLPNCPKVWDLLATGKTKGVFQLESNLGQSWSERVSPKNIDEVAALTAILRPSCLDSFIGDKNITQHYADRKNKREEVESLHPSLDKILEHNQQLIIYQEDALKIAKEVAGFSGVKAEVLRSAIGKKLVEKMQSLKIDFIDGCINTSGLKREDAEMIFDIIEKSQKYSFNACLNPDTVVETIDGEFKDLDEISVGEYIKCPDGYNEVIRKYEQGEQEVFEITLESGKQIICTMLHKFLTEHGDILPLYEIISKGLNIVCEEE
jgi:DNA polymerase-3 subunit alpha